VSDNEYTIHKSNQHSRTSQTRKQQPPPTRPFKS
jgi:hypothetical protein